MTLKSIFKKTILLTGLSIMLSVAYIESAPAQEDSITILKQIEANTREILFRVNDIPNYIGKMLEYALNMQKEDDTQDTADMQTNFATLGTMYTQIPTQQLAVQPRIAQDQWPNADSSTVPDMNDMAYSTLLNQPLFKPDPRNDPKIDPAYNYLKNASAINISHLYPAGNWAGKQPDRLRYSGYYHTIMSAESFGAYVLSGRLAEMQNGNPLSTAQNKLLEQATKSSWIATIASEEIGKVLRQLLMFQSQTYVLMTQILQTQKDLLTAQVMTNSLIIAANQVNEGTLIAKAQGASLAD